ncbi:TPA: heme biosynthesis HemY N-terminal domain-containing protein [Pseudomonas aeruginosa]
MRRIYLLVLAVVLVATLVGLAISEQAGYVLIAYKSFRYESSLWSFLALLAVVWLLVVLVRLVLRLLGSSGRVVNPWSRYNRRRRVQMAEHSGLRDLGEGNWPQALRHLRRAAEMGERPLMHYLGAARAANELERYDEADDLLNRAREREPDAQLLVGLTRAQLLINRGDYPQARNTLEELHGLQPQHRTVLRLMQQLYVTQHDWQALCVLLPELRKERVLKDSELRDLARRAWVASLQEAGERGLNEGETALQPLTQRWQNVPSALRADPAIVAGYAAQLLRLGAEEEAEEVLRHALKQGFDATLVQLYGQVRGRDPGKQLQAAEGWLKEHPNDPGLLLTLGRLCLINKLWGKAREYLEASLSFQRSAETCAELGRLLAQLGEVERSNQLFQEGLVLLDRRTPGLPVVVAGI